jgi:hypothetical protein
LKIAWLITAGVIAFYVSVIRPREYVAGINNSRATGLAAWADRAEPMSYYSRPMLQKGVIGGVPRTAHTPNVTRVRASLGSLVALDADQRESGGESDRKMVSTATMELIVERPAETAEKIRTLAEKNGGFLVSSEVRGGQEATAANLSVRVPVARYEEVRSELRKLALRVETERIDAQDVTRQYTDQNANLRNLKAEEEQYLLILKQARSVKDTLDVSEKLSNVRGQIEQQQAEFNALSKQIETVAIDLSLHTDAEARVMGLNWRPLYQLKIAVRDGLDGVATYLSMMISLVFLLPTVILWLATIALAGWIAWRTLRWIGRRWFGWNTAPASAQS